MARVRRRRLTIDDGATMWQGEHWGGLNDPQKGSIRVREFANHQMKANNLGNGRSKAEEVQWNEASLEMSYNCHKGPTLTENAPTLLERSREEQGTGWLEDGARALGKRKREERQRRLRKTQPNDRPFRAFLGVYVRRVGRVWVGFLKPKAKKKGCKRPHKRSVRLLAQKVVV